MRQLSLFDDEPVKPVLQKSELNIGDIVKVLSTGLVGTIVSFDRDRVLVKLVHGIEERDRADIKWLMTPQTGKTPF